MHFNGILLSLSVAIFASTALADDPEDNPIATELRKAKEAYQLSVENAKDKLADAFGDQQKKLEDNANLKVEQVIKEVDQLQAEKKLFLEDTKNLPRSSYMKTAVSEYQMQLALAKAKATKAFDSASEAYRKKRDLAAAKAVLEEKEQFLANDRKVVDAEAKNGNKSHELAGTYLMKWRGSGADDELFVIDKAGNLTRNIRTGNEKGNAGGKIELRNGEYLLRAGTMIERYSVANGRILVEQFQPATKFEPGKQGDPRSFGVGEKLKK